MTTLTVAPVPVVRAIGAGVPVPTDPEHLSLAVLGPPVFAIKVMGDPGAQGSKAYKGHRNGRAVLVEQSKKVKPWRERVCAAALEVAPSGWRPLDGPLVMDLIVSLPRPVSLPKTLRRLPTGPPDLSKLARAAEDALDTDAKKYHRQIIVNDSRLTTYRRLDKVYAGDPWDTDALRQPGAIIRLWHYPPHLLEKMETP